MSDSPGTVSDGAGRAPDCDSLQRSSAVSTGTRGRAGAITHPPATVIAAFVDRTLTFGEQARLMEHLTHCTVCRELVKSISPRIDFGVRALKNAGREQRRHRLLVAASRSRIRWG